MSIEGFGPRRPAHAKPLAELADLQDRADQYGKPLAPVAVGRVDRRKPVPRAKPERVELKPVHAMSARDWSLAVIRGWMVEAVATLHHLPDREAALLARTQRAAWPNVVHDKAEAYGFDKPKLRAGRAAPEAIDRLDAVIGWLLWLEPEAAALVWLRSARMPWQTLVDRYGFTRQTLYFRESEALLRILARLTASAEGPKERAKNPLYAFNK